jgi:hypothetical protein
MLECVDKPFVKVHSGADLWLLWEAFSASAIEAWPPSNMNQTGRYVFV